MSKYEVILFDLDDTLIDNLENVRHAYTKMVESVGEHYTEEGFKKWYDLDKKFWIDFHEKKIIVPKEYQNPQELFVQYVRSLRYQMYFEGKISLEKAFEINELFLASLKEIVVPIDGVYETLKYLHEKHPNCKFIVSHLENQTREELKKQNIKNIIIPDDGYILEI